MANKGGKTRAAARVPGGGTEWPWLWPALFALVGFVKASLVVPMSDIGGGTLHEWGMNAAMCALGFGWLAALPPRARRPLGWSLQLGLSLMLLADLWYYRYYADLPGFSVLQQVGQVPSVGRSILDLMRPWDVLIVVDLLAWPLLWWGLRGRRDAVARGRARWIAAAALISFGLGLGGVTLATRMQRVPGGVMGGIWSQAWFARIHGPLFYHVWDAGRYLEGRLLGPGEPTAREREAVDASYQRADRRAAQPAPLGGAARGANLIHIQVEALQAQVVGMVYEGQPITPHIDRLRAESLYFEQFYHQAAHGRTADAELAVLCSLLPAPHGVAFIMHPRYPQRCLPEILRAEGGYQTLAFHGHVGRFWNRRQVYPRLGIDRFVAKRELKIDEVIHMGLSDLSFLRQVADELGRQQAPFFAHIITLSSHHPFVMPARERTLKLGAFEGTPIGDYLHAIHYADKAIGAFVEALKQRGLWDRSVVVLYGDHDMGRIRDDGEVSRLFGAVDKGPIQRLAWTRRVPLMIRLPQGKGARVVRSATGMIDLAPTLLHLLGLPGGARDLLGGNALAPGTRPVVFRDGDVTDGALLYLRPGGGDITGGRCLALDTEAALDVERCLPMARQGAQQLEASDVTLVHGLTRDPRPSVAPEAR